MKKERKPLTTREKVLIGLGVVGIGVAGYFGYKYFNDLKTIKDQKNTINDLIKDLMSKDTEAALIDKIEKTIELDRLIDVDENIYA